MEMNGKRLLMAMALLVILGVGLWRHGIDRDMPRAGTGDVAMETKPAADDADAPRVTMDEWQVPWDDARPRDPAVGHDHRIWFVGQKAGFAATFDLVTESFMRYPLVEGSGPHNIIVGPDRAWYAGNLADHIGELDIASGIVTSHDVPREGVQDPHTLIFSADGRGIWFTAQLANLVGYFDLDGGSFRLREVPTPGARPYGIVLDDGGTPWVALFGSNRLARVDRETGEITEIELPRPETRPRRLAVSGGDIWYVDYVGGWLGRYDPETGDVDEWRAPAGDRSGPYAMAADDRGRLWFVETGVQPNRLVAFDPAREEYVVSAPIPSGGQTVRHMVYDRERAALWFGTDANTLVRARIED